MQARRVRRHCLQPTAGGFLSEYSQGQAPEEGTRFVLGTAAERYQYRYWQEAQFAAVETLKQAATARDVSLVTISVAWVLRQPDITSAIIGASSAAQLAANVAATEFEWDDEPKTMRELLVDAAKKTSARRVSVRLAPPDRASWRGRPRAINPVGQTIPRE